MGSNQAIPFFSFFFFPSDTICDYMSSNQPSLFFLPFTFFLFLCMLKLMHVKHIWVHSTLSQFTNSFLYCHPPVLPASHVLWHSRLVLRLLCIFQCLFICASALITCTIIMSRTLLPCELTLVDFDKQFRWLCCYHE